jgi:hypothetical protein
MPYDGYIPPSITPQVGTNTEIVTGGVSLVALPAGCYGGFIVNPLTDADQGLGTAEALFIDPIDECGLAGNGTTIRLEPGESWQVPAPKSTLAVWVNAATSGHKFTAVYWT